MDLIYYNIIHLCKIIIRVYRGHPALAINFTNPLLDTFSLIVKYKTVYKPLEERYLNKNKDDELYLTDCQFWRDRLKPQGLHYHKRKGLKELI